VTDTVMWLCRTCQAPCSADDPFCCSACRDVGRGVNLPGWLSPASPKTDH
jgi:endogenous inhibitor of DNA gyrase (YacG/DUF329 family)